MAAVTEPVPVGSDPPGAVPPPRGRQKAYHPALERVKERVLDGEGVDDWWEIAKYESPRGADNALGRIARGTIDIPEGRFEFDARRILDGTGAVVGSRLLARYINTNDTRTTRTTGTEG